MQLLRLLVACLAFALAVAPPATSVELAAQRAEVVQLATAKESASVAQRATVARRVALRAPVLTPHSIAQHSARPGAVAPPPDQSGLYLSNCSLLC